MKISLRAFNNFLSFLVVGILGYIILSPVFANLQLWWQKSTSPHAGYVYKTKSLSADKKLNDELQDIPKDNRLVIPDIHLDEPIIESDNARPLDKGLWHKPGTGDPVRGGNMVIVGHRYMRDRVVGSGVLFHLDKVKLGNTFSIYWQGKEHVYRVNNIRVVPPSDLSVESQTEKPQITLYTCTPLWTSSERLVVNAEPVGGNYAK